MLALQIYEDGLCSCGQPLILAHDEQNEGWYDVHKPQCQSCAAQELATRGTSNDPYVPAPGEKVFTSFDAKAKAEAMARRATASPVGDPHRSAE